MKNYPKARNRDKGVGIKMNALLFKIKDTLYRLLSFITPMKKPTTKTRFTFDDDDNIFTPKKSLYHEVYAINAYYLRGSPKRLFEIRHVFEVQRVYIMPRNQPRYEYKKDYHLHGLIYVVVDINTLKHYFIDNELFEQLFVPINVSFDFEGVGV